jgi:hypothetical protein
MFQDSAYWINALSMSKKAHVEYWTVPFETQLVTMRHISQLDMVKLFYIVLCKVGTGSYFSKLALSLFEW